jgi:hypothetical protein
MEACDLNQEIYIYFFKKKKKKRKKKIFKVKNF